MNETLKKILALIPDDKKPTADELSKILQDVLDVNETTIVTLTNQKTEAITSRDSAKEKIKSIGTKLNINFDDENFEAQIEAIKNAKGGKGNDELEKYIKQVETLQAEIDTLSTTLKTKEGEHTKELTQVLFEKEFAETVATGKHKVVPKLSKFLEKEVSSRAKFEDGKMILINDDGTQMRINNEPATINSFMDKLRNEEIEAKEGVFFDINIEPSGAGNTGSGGGDGDFVPSNDR